MSDTSIEWTDKTWNCVTGCTKVSPGCAHCYAETIANRKLPHGGFTDRAFTDVRTHADRLDQPLRWREPKRIFVNSMSDLFHEDVPDDFIDKVFVVMMAARQHTFQILTKRADRMRGYVQGLASGFTSEPPEAFRGRWDRARRPLYIALKKAGNRRALAMAEYIGVMLANPTYPASNVWLGVSVENQHFADERIPLLLQTPAAVRFISAEPLLGDIDLSSYLDGHEEHGTPFSGARTVGGCIAWTPPLDWVIVGGESGPGARPFCQSWALNIVVDCQNAGVPVFVKQLGAKPYVTTDDEFAHETWPVGKWLDLKDRKGGDMAEWTPALRVREFPQ